MLVRAKKIVALSVMTLVATAISLPAVSVAATSPQISVQSPLTQGLRAPVKVALDAEGNVYVADQRVGGVVKFNAYGVQQSIIRAANPNGLAFAQDGSLLVSQSSYVARYNVANGQEIGRLTGGQLQSPAGIAVDDLTGFIYVVDSRAGQVEVYTAGGVFSKAFAKGSLSSPTGIAFEKVSRQLVVADTLNNKVQFFDMEGTFVKSVGVAIPGGATSIFAGQVAPMQFLSPVAVAFEYSKVQPSVLNRMYVVDAFQGNVQVIDPVGAGSALVVAGTTKNYIGSVGTANGQLMVPSDASYDAVNGRLLVVNGFGNITVFGVDGGKNPVYVEPVTPVDPPVALTPAPVFVVAAVPAITRSASVVVTGTVDSGSAVTVVNQTTSKAGEAVVVGGSWSYEVALVEGLNSLSFSAQKSNSEKSVAAASLSLDTTSPFLTVSALATGSNATDPVQNISGTVTDQNGASITVNGVSAVLSGNAFSVPVTLLNGSNQISVVAVDAAGNTSANNRTLNYNAGSGLSVTNPVDNSMTASSSLNINGSVSGALSVTVAGIPVAVVDGGWVATVELVSGVNTIEIVALDVVGNSSSIKRTITLDAAKPALAVVAPAQDIAVNVPNVLISGTVSDPSAITLEYALNGSTVSVPVNDASYSFNIDFAAEGIYPVALSAKDAAGNISTVVRNVIYDKTPPAFSLNQVNGVMPEKLSGTVEAGSSIVVKDGNAQVGSVVVTNGSWVADLTGVNYNPENLLAVATDAAGNSTSKTLTYNFPDGTLNGTGKPTVQDALRSIRLVVNQSSPSAVELAHYDIGPLVNGKPNPNGKIEIVDAILILRKALGLKSW